MGHMHSAHDVHIQSHTHNTAHTRAHLMGRETPPPLNDALLIASYLCRISPGPVAMQHMS